MSTRRVVVTGMGIISPVGNDVETAWRNVREGRSGIRRIEEIDPTEFATQIGGEVRDFDIGEYISPRDARRMDRFMHYGIAASVDAVKDAGIEVTPENSHRIGVAMGAGIGGLATIEDNYGKYLAGGARKVSPFFIPGSIINMTSGNVSIMYGMTGPNLSIVTACATSTHSIGIAARSVIHGDADIMLAGGSEYATTALGLGGFCAARAMTTRNEEPEKASRPFDRDRDGFALANGAGCLVLEELEHARARGAKIYAELIGFGMSGDAYHITSPPEDGEGARKCMVAALSDAGISPEDIDYLNAHGTSTPVGDKGETAAIKRAFGDYARSLAVSSTKSCTGHLLGAAGAVEAIFSILAIRDQVLPPTINLENPDPDCDLDYVPNAARAAKVRTVISNSFGFGGTNASLVFRAVD
ncbi:MAG: beta-ketoacyl-ACP synthase II [Gammaproteobacteria bacterium]|nr:beta-ketoacyl-ACP synthase II [Gammaproteobacteria bacterium]MDH5345065.1 beta-ketoacyl-ACP synthase II [Gammaproteobacteria bacterium]